MGKLNLAVFHYHFVPGGITTVVKLSIKSLLANYQEIGKIALISGRKAYSEDLISYLKSSFPEADITWETLPDLDYLKEGSVFTRENINNIENILEKYRGYLYWIHNYHIGKNSLFTKIITDFALKRESEKFLFHIHDFPECSRYSNYRNLIKLVSNPYPSGRNIKYAVLNSRDYQFMKSSGFNENSVFLLPNPVIQNKNIRSKLTEAEKKKIKDNIYIRTKDIFDFKPEKPVFLYPVRTIRRKNVFEAALISLLSFGGSNLIQTLPGISDQEIKYSDIIYNFYRKGLIKGLWGTGIKDSPAEIDLNRAVDISDIIISSSVMEGFGYIFTDTLTWGKPIISRDLDTSKDFIPLFTDKSSYFYKSFSIPLDEKLKTELVKQYRKYLKHLSAGEMDIPDPDYFIDNILSGNTVDFSYLSCDQQSDFFMQSAESRLIQSDLREINSSLITKTKLLASSENEISRSDISKYYGPEIFTEIFSKIINSFEKNTLNAENSSKISEKLFSMFTTAESIRLITGSS